MVIVAALMIVADPVFVILLFHISFLLLTVGAFYWSFRDFTVRAGFWVTITLVLLLRAIVDHQIYAGELVEIPLLTSMLVLVFMIAEERTKAKEKLHQSEERYHTLFDNVFKESRDAIFITDQAGKIVDVNQSMLDLFGYSRDEITASTVQGFPNSVLTEWEELIRKTGQLGSVRDYNIKLQKNGGAEMDALLTLSLWRNPIGKLLGYQGIIRDITQHKKAEAERIQLLIKEREQRILAETQGEVFLALAAQTSYETVLDEILRQVQRVVSYKAANIVILKRDILHIARHQGYQLFSSREIIPHLKQSLDEFPLDAEVIRSRRPILICDTQQNSQWVAMEESAWIRSFIAIPICLRDRVLGLLRLDSDTPDDFSMEDLKRLEPLANAAAIALDNARLFDQARQEVYEQAIQSEAEIIQLNEKLLSLQYASTTIASSSRLQLILTMIPKEMAGLLKVKGCCILEGDQVSKTVSVIAKHGYDTDWEQNQDLQTFSLSNYPLMDRVLTERIQQQITRSHANMYPAESSFMQSLKLKTLLIVPMEFQNRVIGLVQIMDDQRERIFTNREIGLIQILANQVASAIENNRLYDQVRQEITDRMQVEKVLRQVATKNQAILEAISDSLFYLNQKGEILGYKIISGSSELLGLTREISNGKNLSDILSPEWASLIRRYIGEALSTNTMQIFEYELPSPSDKLYYFEVRMVVSGENEVLAIIRNITERKEQEAALEKERSRIARDLHDSLGQSLGFLRLKLDTFTTVEVVQNVDQVQEDLIQMRDVTNEAYELVRSMLAAARPSNLTDLATILMAEGRAVGNRARFKVRLTSEGQAGILSPVVQQQVLYIFKEAINNVEKYANAKHLDIHLVWKRDALVISILDDGVGFNTAPPLAEGHFGLAIMEERAREINGTLSVISNPGAGTEITLSLDLKPVSHPLAV
ncbi:MAG: PAS domain S-box protein [Anaerolineae bacterium]